MQENSVTYRNSKRYDRQLVRLQLFLQFKIVRNRSIREFFINITIEKLLKIFSIIDVTSKENFSLARFTTSFSLIKLRWMSELLNETSCVKTCSNKYRKKTFLEQNWFPFLYCFRVKST